MAIGAYWAVDVAFLAIVVLWRAPVEHALAMWWRRRGGQGEEWTGRTTWALAAGRLIRQVTFLAGKKGQDLWESKWPQDRPTETLGSESRRLGTDESE